MPTEVDGKLVFVSDEEKVTALQNIQEQLENGVAVSDDEMERIKNAEVQADGEQPANTEPEPSTDPEPKPDVPRETVVVGESKPKRKWEITEDMVPEDATVYDKQLGRERKIWTFGDDPEDIVKTVINEQKQIRHLYDQLDQTAAELEKARSADRSAELQARIAELEKKLAERETRQAENIDKGTATIGDDEYSKLMKQLETFDPSSEDYDVVEHNKVLAKAMRMGQDRAAILVKEEIAKLREDTEKRDSERIERDKKAQEDREKQEKQRIQQETAQKAMKQAFTEVDEFVRQQEEKGSNYYKTGKTFEQMTQEADAFHLELARAVTNKYVVTSDDISQAVARYQSGDQLIRSAASSKGVSPPKDYQVWDELNQIEAIRTGWFCDPLTRKWSRRADVRFPDMDTARDYFDRATGRRSEKERQAKVDAQKKITNVLNKRDLSVVQMDTSKATEGETGLTEEQAAEILNQDADYGMENMMYDYRAGKKDRFDRHNIARQRLGLGALETV